MQHAMPRRKILHDSDRVQSLVLTDPALKQFDANLSGGTIAPNRGGNLIKSTAHSVVCKIVPDNCEWTVREQMQIGNILPLDV